MLALHDIEADDERVDVTCDIDLGSHARMEAGWSVFAWIVHDIFPCLDSLFGISIGYGEGAGRAHFSIARTYSASASAVTNSSGTPAFFVSSTRERTLDWKILNASSVRISLGWK